MKRTQHRQQGKNGFDLIEEATHLLRTAPVATLAAYYLGAIPFVLGLLYFWADMSKSPFAPQHLAAASLGLAGLFLWMKFWQSIFAGRIRAQAGAAEMPPLGFRRCARIFFGQAVVQPSALFLLPLALIPILPFGRAYAFYQNVTALGEGNEKDGKGLFKNSWSQAWLWPRQNHVVLLILGLFGICIFLNWFTACLALPQLFKMFFGVESVFTRSPFAMMNTTLLAGMCALTYLCLDPLLKTIYALRCFYGQSLQSGEDLKAELKPFAISTASAASLVRLLLLVLALQAGLSARAVGAEASPATTPPATVKSGIPPPDLDKAINQTIHERKYTWRMPRDKAVQPESGGNIVTRFFDHLGSMIRDMARAVSDWLDWLWHKLFPDRQSISHDSGNTGYGWIFSVHFLLYGLAAAAIVALLIFFLRVWRGRRQASAVVASEPIQPAPDITDENVRADQLPEDGWTKLARELLERGEFRLAMRAFYLSSLAHLAARNLIHLARFKSNRDYERELRRRAHSLPGLLALFGDNLLTFEGIWYGMHEVNRQLVDGFASNVERIRAGE